MWKGFSKSAGALGVRKKTVPSSASTRASSRDVALGVVEVLDEVRGARPVEAAPGEAQGQGVHLGHLQAVGAPPAARRRRRRRRCSRPRPPVRSGDRNRADSKPWPQPDVEHGARAQPLDDRPVAGGVEGQQRVRGDPLHGPLAGEPPGRPRRAPAPSPPPARRIGRLVWSSGSPVVSMAHRVRARRRCCRRGPSGCLHYRSLVPDPQPFAVAPTVGRRRPRSGPGLWSRRLRSPGRLRAVRRLRRRWPSWPSSPCWRPSPGR